MISFWMAKNRNTEAARIVEALIKTFSYQQKEWKVAPKPSHFRRYLNILYSETRHTFIKK